jgi:putative transposase
MGGLRSVWKKPIPILPGGLALHSQPAGKAIELLTPHLVYRRLGKTVEERQEAYRALFRGRMPERDVATIRDATNKAWVLGDDRFKAQIEAKTGRRPTPSGRGSDRKSAEFLKAKNQ